jgi:hypothetical protein
VTNSKIEIGPLRRGQISLSRRISKPMQDSLVERQTPIQPCISKLVQRPLIKPRIGVGYSVCQAHQLQRDLLRFIWVMICI